MDTEPLHDEKHGLMENYECYLLLYDLVMQYANRQHLAFTHHFRRHILFAFLEFLYALNINMFRISSYTICYRFQLGSFERLNGF